MQSDLAGRVRNTKLAARHALLPLFEAIANSIDSIVELGNLHGRVKITIDRGISLFGDQPEDSPLLPEIAGFVIEDNGIGFTTKNFASFETLDSLSKQLSGGKGVGRLLWLVAFDQASVDSRFSESGKHWNRRFQFLRSSAGVENAELIEVSGEDVEQATRVRLSGFREKYREIGPKSAKAISRRIIEHFLLHYMLDSVPAIEVHDPSLDVRVDLNDLYREEFIRGTSSRVFEVKGVSFEIRDVLLRASAEAESALHYCANRRVVKSQRLSSMLAHAESAFSVDGEDVYYAGCIMGEYLDDRVDAQRTDFLLDHDGELELHGQRLEWEDVVAGAARAVEEYLKSHIDKAREESIARIRQFVEAEEPRYRVLLEHRPELVGSLSGTLSDERLEIELHRALQDWRLEAKRDAAKQLRGVKEGVEGFSKFKDSVVRALGALQEVAKADLADYVVHRRAVLDFFEQLLGMNDDGKFAKEDALHGLFFPQRTSSDRVDYEDHNLWLIDEALAFHRYLASDLSFESQVGSPLEIEDKRRPDLLIYNRRMAFSSEEQRPFSSVVIVEFKRPELNSYSDDRNPVSQVYGYVRELREGRARNADGSRIDRLGATVPCFCNIVVSLTPSLREQLEDMGFASGPDEQSYFFFNPSLKAYVEVSSYSRVLQNAVRRNKAFFEKLNLHTSSRRM